MRTLVAIALFTASVACQAAPLTLPALFELLGKKGPTRVQFTEKKYLSLLSQPVESRGELVFTPPDRLEKRTLAPKPESVVVERDRVRLERAGKTYSVGLRENPAIAVLVESIRATLAGDLASLTRTYSAALSGDATRWKLTLRPLDPAVATIVEHIEIGGVQGDVRQVETFQADGDRSVTTIAPSPGG